jgi:hypothetical protein
MQNLCAFHESQTIILWMSIFEMWHGDDWSVSTNIYMNEFCTSKSLFTWKKGETVVWVRCNVLWMKRNLLTIVYVSARGMYYWKSAFLWILMDREHKWPSLWRVVSGKSEAKLDWYSFRTKPLWVCKAIN